LEKVSLPDGVEFLGVLKGNDLQAAYAGATVFCLPSVEDGFGLVLNEAISYGLPVIATENTGIDDLLLDGKGGMVVPIRDPGAIAAFLNRLAEDPAFLESQRRDALAAAARLADPARRPATLSGTLLETFQQHHAEVHEPA
jgi:glycosyltransferase involved in cell wall biosynthesis